jgi:hypothetical protein
LREQVANMSLNKGQGAKKNYLLVCLYVFLMDRKKFQIPSAINFILHSILFSLKNRLQNSTLVKLL